MAEKPAIEEKKSIIQRIRSLPQTVQESSPIQMTMMVLGGIVAVFVLCLLLSVIGGIATGNSDGVAATVAIVRDLFIILLALQGMLIAIALIVMILQLATLINLLQNEINPIVKNFQDASNTLKGTSEFLSENLTAPVIETRAALSGVGAFFKELYGIRKALIKNGSKNGSNGSKEEEGVKENGDAKS